MITRKLPRINREEIIRLGSIYKIKTKEPEFGYRKIARLAGGSHELVRKTLKGAGLGHSKEPKKFTIGGVKIPLLTEREIANLGAPKENVPNKPEPGEKALQDGHRNIRDHMSREDKYIRSEYQKILKEIDKKKRNDAAKEGQMRLNYKKLRMKIAKNKRLILEPEKRRSIEIGHFIRYLGAKPAGGSVPGTEGQISAESWRKLSPKSREYFMAKKYVNTTYSNGEKIIILNERGVARFRRLGEIAGK